ncbi:MAG TPA: hypothetical protein VLA64_06905 [Azonexus sp.]|nr:hypothetical protein [Azonexus sp.]
MRRAVFGVVLQDRFVVLAAVENANDRYLLGVHVEGDHGAFLVVGDVQAGPHRTSSRTGAAMGSGAEGNQRSTPFRGREDQTAAA